MIQDSFQFLADTSMQARYFKPEATFTAKCSGRGEPNGEGVTRPRFSPDVEPDFLDATVRYVYLRIRGSSVRTFFLACDSEFMTQRDFRIKVSCYVHDTGETFEFYLEDNSIQQANNNGFGEYVNGNDQCTVTFTFKVES